jgi:hypothetical protein
MNEAAEAFQRFAEAMAEAEKSGTIQEISDSIVETWETLKEAFRQLARKVGQALADMWRRIPPRLREALLAEAFPDRGRAWPLKRIPAPLFLGPRRAQMTARRPIPRARSNPS